MDDVTPTESLTRIILEPRRLRFKLVQLKREGLFTDITLTCHGKAIHVHKCILSASSLFFKLLFTAQLEPLHMFDLSALVKQEQLESLESIISYMYSGEIHLSEKNFTIIASLSKFLSMTDLTGLCSSFQGKIMKPKNCLKFYLSMREFEALAEGTVYPVKVYRGTEIEDAILEMLDKMFYKSILPQPETLQLSPEDLLHILGHSTSGMVKKFSVKAALEFVVSWLTLHKDPQAYKVASLIVHQACQSILYETGTNQKFNAIVSLSEKINDLLTSVAEPDTAAMKSDLTMMRAEAEKLEKMYADVKQEVVEDPDTPLEGGAGSMEVNNDSLYEEEEAKLNDLNNSDTDDYDPKVKQEPIKTETKVNRRKGKARRALPSSYDDDEDDDEDDEEEEEYYDDEELDELDEANENEEEMMQVDDEIKKGLTKAMAENAKKASEGKYKCPMCDKSFKRKYTLDIHVNSHTGTNSYRCVECGKLFYRNYDMVRHLQKKHKDKKSFECDVCDQVCEDAKSMAAHIHFHNIELMGGEEKEKSVVEPDEDYEKYAEVRKSEEGKPEYWCTVCKKQFTRQSHLREHVMSHTGHKPYRCSTCDSPFKNKYDLNRHMDVVHLGKKLTCRYKCENCKRPFNSKENFDKHCSACIGRNYQCNQCSASFHRQYHLDRHLKTHSEERPYKCPECPKTFKFDNKLKAHVRTHDKVEAAKRTVVCELCGAILKDVKYLKRHLISHTGLKPHKCPVCLKTYTQAAGLQIHMRIHTGAKPYQCEICSMLFAVKSNLMRHQRRHRGDRRHKCDQCGKGFVMMGDLRRHYTIHTGEKNYECRYCGKKFSSNSKLPQHERIHTGEKPYECRVCGKRFIQSGDRTRHEAIHGIKTPPKQKHLPLCQQTFDNQSASTSNTETTETSPASKASEIVRSTFPSAVKRMIAEKKQANNESGINANSRDVVNSRGSLDTASSGVTNNTDSSHGQDVERDLFSKQHGAASNDFPISMVNREVVPNNPLLSSQVLLRTHLLPTVVGERPTNTMVTTGYMDQGAAIATSRSQDQAMMSDMYSGSTVYTTQTGATATFLGTLSDNTFMHY